MAATDYQKRPKSELIQQDVIVTAEYLKHFMRNAYHVLCSGKGCRQLRWYPQHGEFKSEYKPFVLTDFQNQTTYQYDELQEALNAYNLGPKRP